LKKVLITAATSSIGKIIAKHFAKAGYSLVLHYNTNEKLANEIADSYSAELIQADLSDVKSAESFISSLKGGDYDVIVNNAGLAKSINELDFNQWEEVLRVNTLVPTVIMAQAKDSMADKGCIINISSLYGHELFGELGLEAYDASKAALNSMTRTYAKKLAPHIRINAVAPGYVDSAWNAGMSEEERSKLKKDLLIEEFVDPEDVASLVLHVAENKSINGEVIYIDGGQMQAASIPGSSRHL
jgi:3-oxoacyl-[acyl-carrier protein] reductase